MQVNIYFAIYYIMIMKKLIFLMMLPMIVFGQPKWNELPKGATKVITTVTESQEEALKKISLVLLDNSYTIEKTDKELMYLTTDWREIKYWNFQFTFRCKEDSVIITGMINPNISINMSGVEVEIHPFPVEKKMGSTSANGYGFMEMDRLARLIGKEVFYR